MDPADKSDTELKEHLSFIDALVVEDARAKQQGRVADVRAIARQHADRAAAHGGALWETWNTLILPFAIERGDR